MSFALPKEFFGPSTSHHTKQVCHGTSAIRPSVRAYWRCALVDYESAESEEGNIISFDNGSNYYWAHDVDPFKEGES